MKKGVEIHPLSAKGKYYIDENTCVCSDNCAYLAPNNFTYNNEGDYGYYVCKQPENAAEEALCQQAIRECPVEAIHDDGEDL